MVHNKKHIPKDLEKKDFVIYETRSARLGVQYLNPGSCGPRRFHQPVTMAVLTIEAEGFHIERDGYSSQSGTGKSTETFPERYGKADKGNLKRAGKGNHRGFHGKKISGFKGVAEQVCRICVTHPGVTAHGIMDKMEVNKVVSKSSKNS